MTPGPWRQGNLTGSWPARFAGPCDVVASPPPDGGDGEWLAVHANPNFRDIGAANVAGIVALRNAFQALLDELTTLRSALTEACDLAERGLVAEASARGWRRVLARSGT